MHKLWKSFSPKKYHRHLPKAKKSIFLQKEKLFFNQVISKVSKSYFIYCALSMFALDLTVTRVIFIGYFLVFIAR
jgi:hypothetical protein